MRLTKQEAREVIARAFRGIEDIVYIGLGILLAALVLILLTHGLITFVRSALDGTLAQNIAEVLDQALLILLIVELLYTVQVSFRAHALSAEPFLLVGLIAAIRRVLVLTAEFREQAQKGPEAAHQLVVELAMLAGLILALALSLVLLRRRSTPTITVEPAA
jgi:uncharacterized membrane protein (DUF373 family)